MEGESNKGGVEKEIEDVVESKVMKVGSEPVLVDREVTLHHHHGNMPSQSSEPVAEGSIIEEVLVFLEGGVVGHGSTSVVVTPIEVLLVSVLPLRLQLWSLREVAVGRMSEISFV